MCHHNNEIDLICDPLYPKKASIQIWQIIGCVGEAMPENLSPNGIRLSILSWTCEDTRWSFPGLWWKKDPEFEAHQIQTIILNHIWKSYHEIHDEKEEILGDEILDLYDSYNLQNSYDF